MNIFVTGTDTGVGKTVVSTLLCLKFGFRYWKPIQSGTLDETDSKWVAKRIGSNSVDRECYILSAPVSPHASAKIDGIEINFQRILTVAQGKSNTVIEGAGGVLVPINDHFFLIDLMASLKFRVLIVARSSVGTINHTLLTIEALRTRGIKPWCVVLVGDNNQVSKDAIEKYGNIRVVSEVPKFCSLDLETLRGAASAFDLREENLA